MNHGVQLDQTGLHAKECECLRCETGYRPTPSERWHAAETLRQRREMQTSKPESAKQRQAREARERRQREALDRARERSEELARWCPLTPQQRAELQAAKPQSLAERKHLYRSR